MGKKFDVGAFLSQLAAWIVGVLLMPLVPIACLVIILNASFVVAVGQGELFELGLSVAGASLALELVLDKGSWLRGAYKLGLMLILLANALFYAAVASVEDDAVTTRLTEGQHNWSITLAAAAMLFGFAGFLRQSIEGLRR